jgi:hypothetical protein
MGERAALAARQGLRLTERVAMMPANNLALVFHKA